MSNDLIKPKSWLKRNWKLWLPITILSVLAATLFFSQTSGHLGNFVQAYSDPKLYEDAVAKAQQNEEVTATLGEIEPLSKMAILEGDVEYTNQNKNVRFAVRIVGKLGKARMDVEAMRVNDSWEYKTITVRIKNPQGKIQSISVLE